MGIQIVQVLVDKRHEVVGVLRGVGAVAGRSVIGIIAGYALQGLPDLGAFFRIKKINSLLER